MPSPCQPADILPQCDETKPECKKCATFGVTCTYDRKAADIQMSFEGTGTIMSTQNLPRSTNHTFINLTKVPNFQYPVISDDNATLKMDSLSMERLGRFFKRTVLSIGTVRAGHIFQDAILGMAFAVRCHSGKSDCNTNILFFAP
jgi:hypothetical protein